MHLTITVVLVCVTGLNAVSIFGHDKKGPEQKLGQKLLDDYDPRWRPVKANSDSVQVSIKAELLRLKHFCEKTNTMSAQFFVTKMWKNDLLKWDPSEHDGIQQMNFDTEDMWYPDIDHYNRAEPRDFALQQSNYGVIVDPTGGCVHVDDAHYKTTNCTKNGEDIKCRITVGSWYFNDGLLNVTALGVGTDYVSEHPTLKLESLTMTRENKQYAYDLTKNYPRIHINIHAKKTG